MGLHIGLLELAQKLVAARDGIIEALAFFQRIADKATATACLAWPPRDEPYPVGYYCGLRDPDGNFVEFSYGQPLGPGAPSET